jgi:hypothetical protein
LFLKLAAEFPGIVLAFWRSLLELLGQCRINFAGNIRWELREEGNPCGQ